MSETDDRLHLLPENEVLVLSPRVAGLTADLDAQLAAVAPAAVHWLRAA